MCSDPSPAPTPPAAPYTVAERSARVAGRTVAYADHGARAGGRPLLALHGSFGRGAVFGGIARLLAGTARVIAPDLRGHGRSGPSDDLGHEALVADAAAFVRHLGLGPLPVLGHSAGGILAYKLAARHPDLVSALIIEDVGPVMRRPEIEHPVLDVRGWPRTAATRAALGAAIEAAGVPDAGYFLRSAVPAEDGNGWRLLFDWDAMMDFQQAGVGDWWDDWLGSRCPALVLRGGAGSLLPPGLAHDMVRRRPDTRLVEFPHAGHWVHDDDPHGTARAIGRFLTGGAG